MSGRKLISSDEAVIAGSTLGGTDESERREIFLKVAEISYELADALNTVRERVNG